MPKFQVTVEEIYRATKIIEAPDFDHASIGDFPDYDDIECDYHSAAVVETVPCCKFCEDPIESVTFHSHQDGVVCTGCWDERLRVTS